MDATFSDATTANTIAAAIFNPGGAGDGGSGGGGGDGGGGNEPSVSRDALGATRTVTVCQLPPSAEATGRGLREAMKKNASQFSVDRAGRDWGFARMLDV